MLYYELLKPGESINGERYRTQLIRLKGADYHLFRSMQNALTGIRFTSEQGIKNWLDSFLATKLAQFFWDGVHKLPERWEKSELQMGNTLNNTIVRVFLNKRSNFEKNRTN